MTSKYNVAGLLFTGLAFHLIYLASVFDCYFTSPVVHGMQSYALPSGEAKRLVLIVGDGLRADLLFTKNGFPADTRGPDAPAVVAPHLRSIAETRGAFGISHTRVPTESRPGHVAIIGGMYEDVSAVMKGWKTNPVDFDSVFNQSSTTFSFGSPDILPMFARGAVPGRVLTWCYDESEEDFTKDATALDIWVFDQLQSLFRNATTDAALDARLRAPQVVFFLHLLGLDTTGHSYRPFSAEYMNNIRVVDDIVRRTERAVRDFFQDDETSYLFTADHGMSVIGNHGDGHPDNTRTPVIAWGRGVRGPLPDTSPTSHEASSSPWELGHLYRRDVEQADLAPLMAALLGVNWPVNSVGVLPDVDSSRPGFLAPAGGERRLAEASAVNARMILEQYRVKHELKQSQTVWYKPFPRLVASQMDSIEKALDAQQWDSARKLAAGVIQDGLDGLRYLQTYERRLIKGMVIASYLGWAAYAALFIIRPLDAHGISVRGYQVVTSTALGVLGAFWALFAVQKSPWTYYVYVAFPCYFWQQVVLQMTPYIRAQNSGGWRFGRGLFYAAAVFVVLQSMVLAYVHRFIWSVGFVVIGVLWPLTSGLCETRLWSLSCIATAIFPLLSVDKEESISTITLGGCSMLAFAALFLKFGGLRKPPTRLFAIQAGLIVAAMVVTASSVHHLQNKLGLPLANQVAGWAILVLASALPFVTTTSGADAHSKLLMFFLAFGVCFVILSISVEGLFYVAYSSTLLQWIRIEQSVRGKDIRASTQYRFQADDIRIALFFLFFVQVGFFGTGNVASISSFYLAPVYRLIPIFSPFAMALLLVFKIVAPYIMLSVVFATLNNALRLPPFSLFLVALTLTDGMTLAFFFNVTDTGSWLEIGQSITFFCVASLLLVWSAGVCIGGEYLMADVILEK